VDYIARRDECADGSGKHPVMQKYIQKHFRGGTIGGVYPKMD